MNYPRVHGVQNDETRLSMDTMIRLEGQPKFQIQGKTSETGMPGTE